jgi:hypothetical protein
MDAHRLERDRWIRSDPWVRAFGIEAGLLALVFAAIAVWIMTSYPHFGESFGNYCAVAVVGLIGVASGYLARGCWRAALRISDERIVVCNPIRCQVIPTSEAVAFAAGNVTPSIRDRTPGIVLILKNGTRVPVWALARESTIWSAQPKTDAFRDWRNR